MTPMDHYRESERLLDRYDRALQSSQVQQAPLSVGAAALTNILMLAQVHATLARVPKDEYLR